MGHKKAKGYSSTFKYKKSFRKCFVCGIQFGVYPHHILPRDQGGTDDPKNIVYLCENHHDEVEGQPWSEIIKLRKAHRSLSKIDAEVQMREQFITEEGIIFEYDPSRKCWMKWTKHSWGLERESCVDPKHNRSIAV